MMKSVSAWRNTRGLALLMLVSVVWLGATTPARAYEGKQDVQALAPEPRAISVILGEIDRHYAAREDLGALTLELAAHDTAEAAEKLVRIGWADWRPATDAAVHALGTMTSPEVVAYLLELYDQAEGESAWPVRVMLVKVFGKAATGGAGLELLMKAAQDPVAAVRIAAVEVVSSSERAEAEQVAVAEAAVATAEALGDGGRSHAIAVEVLTQADRSDEAEPEADDEVQARPRRPRGRRGGPGGQGPVRGRDSRQAGGGSDFFDTPVYSRELLIIIDTSESMGLFDVLYPGRYRDVPDVPPDNPQLVARGQGTTANDRVWERWLARNPEAIRIERVKLELESLVESLPDDTRLNIVAYNSHITPLYRDGLRRLGDGVNREAAMSWIEGLEPDSMTYTTGAFEDALALGDTRHRVDTILFFSDGVPTTARGRLMDTDEALAIIYNLNYFGTIQIDTFIVGNVGVPFMRELAEQNGGTFRHLNGLDR